MFRLTVERRNRRYSQTLLAHLTSCTQRRISEFENGECRPTPQQLQSLSEALGLEPDELFEVVEEVRA